MRPIDSMSILWWIFPIHHIGDLPIREKRALSLDLEGLNGSQLAATSGAQDVQRFLSFANNQQFIQSFSRGMAFSHISGLSYVRLLHHSNSSLFLEVYPEERVRYSGSLSWGCQFSGDHLYWPQKSGGRSPQSRSARLLDLLCQIGEDEFGSAPVRSCPTPVLELPCFSFVLF